MSRIDKQDVEELRQLANVLRTTTDKQGFNRLLNKRGEYCCIGIHQKMRGVSDSQMFDRGIAAEIIDYKSLPSGKLFEDINFIVIDRSVPPTGQVMKLEPATLNDFKKYTFEKIADIIDYNCDLVERANSNANGK